LVVNISRAARTGQHIEASATTKRHGHIIESGAVGKLNRRSVSYQFRSGSISKMKG